MESIIRILFFVIPVDAKCFHLKFIRTICFFTLSEANYVQKLKETLPTLSSALEELRVRRSDMQREIDLAEQRLLVRREQVQLWLSKAENMITEAENLIADAPREIDNLCLGGCVSKNCMSSYKFGKKVVKMIQDIKDHMCKAAFEKGSLASMAHGGVGKTTLLTQINNKFSTTRNDFDVVIWALVSKDCSVGGIQDEIGRKIGFTNDSWKNKRVDHKALDIYGVLRSKKSVVLLDDLWERVDLKEIGIPKPSKENGSKLVFTTPSLEVCGEMEAVKRIKVECLESEKAWKLFQDKVGHETLNSHPHIPKLAKQLAEKCVGLPLALITIGRAMASKTTPEEWKYAIRKLERFAMPKMEKEHASMKQKRTTFFVKTGAQLFEEPDVKAWEGTKRMSVMKNQIEVLRETPKCPNLHTLFLSDNKLQGIRHSFFQFMPHITVLNLSKNSGLGALPEGVSQLISLECLDLSWTGIAELPLELKSLTKLKMLDLSYMNNLRKIARHLISSFSMLQIFKMRGLICGDHPDEDNVLSEDYGNLIQELKSLQHLNILSIPAIKSMFALENFLSFHLFRCCTQSLQLSDFRMCLLFYVLNIWIA
ncbi:hypothetical protein V6N12_034803 [Hibiscus sabdariffa]